MEPLDLKSIEYEGISFEQLLGFKMKNPNDIKDVFIVPPSIDFDLSDDDDFGHVVVRYKTPHDAFLIQVDHPKTIPDNQDTGHC